MGAQCVRMWLDLIAQAIHFYQRNGFQTVGEMRFQCGADIHRDVVMVRSMD